MAELKPLMDIGYGTGNPSGMPDYRPMNPWGRAMPKPSRGPRPALWQIAVKWPDGTRKPYGPRMEEDAARSLFATLNTLILDGKEKEVSEPELVCVSVAGGEKPKPSLRVAR